MALRPGTRAPDFTAAAGDGSIIRLADYRGRKLILYFYPRDDTPGCTAQACSLRDAAAEIGRRGTAILGVSAQDAASHRRFSAKYKLKFPLLCDSGRTIAKAYDAAGSGPGGWLRGLFGINRRISYLIDAQGYIARVVENPDCKGHGGEMLAFL